MNAEAIANYMKAFTNPTRVQILFCLQNGRMYSEDIRAAIPDCSGSTVSQQLAYLHRMRIVSGKREKQRTYYELIDRNIPDILDIIKKTDF
jgi:DNA-binding HxlR family transcriptional regulator